MDFQRDPAAYIDSLRDKSGAQAGLWFPDVMTIYGPGTETPDGAGGFTTAPTVIAANVRCKHKLLTQGAAELLAGGQVEAVSTHTIECPYGTDIKASYYVVVAARGDVPALTFQINGAFESSTQNWLKFGATLKGR
jgi:hypothetical protein